MVLSETPRTERSGDLPERLGVYRIESCLGRGGMGEVYLAWDELLERHVAIKRIRGDRLQGDEQRARFLREARAVARLDHPAIVRVYHVLERRDGPSLVMEYVEGRELGQLITAGEIGVARAVGIAREIAEGLGEAHRQGMIHRDLKPANVMVTETGGGAWSVKILDFGLAKFLWRRGAEPFADDDSLTQTGALLGTVYAMSPEQASQRALDHRSDLFALGSLLYLMLTGCAPFRGEGVLNTLRRVVLEEPEPLAERVPEAPPELVRLVDELLAKNPVGRPANARLVAVRLAAIADRLNVGNAAPPAGGVPDPVSAPGWVPGADDPTSTTAQRPFASPSHAENLSTVVEPWAAVPPAEPSPIVRTLVHAELAEGPTAPFPSAVRDLLGRWNAMECEASRGLTTLFEHPAEAVAFALVCHRVLADAPGTPAARIGVSLGEVVLRRGGAGDSRPLQVEGEARLLAARLAAGARQRQILLDRAAFDLARGALAPASLAAPEVRWLAHGTYGFAALDESVEIFEVGVAGVAPLAAPAERQGVRRLAAPGEEIALGWRPAVGQAVPRRPNWELVERLGEGGFGEIWLARHKAGEERVFKFCFEAERLRALKREVTLFRLLRETLGQRRDIARLLDWDFDESPYFLEAEYTDGGSLDAWAERRGGLASVPLTTRLGLVAEVAEALAAAHSVGVLHKDVKPQNILVAHDDDGRPQALLTDFGIGLLTERERLREPGFTVLGFTETGLGDDSLTGGTVRYMAPELLEGKPATIHGDVYALGVLLFQIVAGDFRRALAPGWRREIGDELLAEDIAACVDGRPENRLASAGGLAERLRSLEERRSEREAEAAAERARIRARRRRRIAAWLGAAAGVMLLVISLFAWDAYEARQAAEARRQQAEELLDFLLGDLRAELQPIGKLEILDKVGDRAMDYFAAVPEEDLSDEEVAHYAKALHQIGQVRFALGKVGEAAEAFGESLAMAKGLVARDPENAEWRFELGQSHFWLGFLRWRSGDLAAALESFEAYRRISEALVARDPGNEDWQLELAYSQSNVGQILEEQGELEEAEAALETSADVFGQLMEGRPDDHPYLVELALVEAKLGRVLQVRGDLDHALARYRHHLDLVRRAGRAVPESAEVERFVAIGHYYVAEVLQQRGELGEALEHYAADLEILEDLVRHDPENLAWRGQLVLRHGKLARARLAAGDPEQAQAHLERGDALLAGLLEADPEHRLWRLEAARQAWSWARLLAARDRYDAAIKRVEAAWQALEILEREAPSRIQELWLTQTAWLLGEVRAALGDAAAARASFEAGLAVAQRLAEEDPRPVHLDALVRLLVALERRDAAEPWIATLEAMGYRDPAYLAAVGLRP